MQVNEKRVAQHFRNFERAIAGYTYSEPLSRYLTRFFKENKQMGSSDRKMTSRFMYNYFRIGRSLSTFSVADRLAFAEYLCEDESAYLFVHMPALHETIQQLLDKKLALLIKEYGFQLRDIFPLVESISASVDVKVFLKSQFIQPDLFIRVQQKYMDEVIKTFAAKEVPYTKMGTNSLQLPNGLRLQDFPSLTGKFEVQDLSSQRTIAFMEANNQEKWWDACAASGGKALMLLDKYPHIDLFVSDIRLSILRNLNERFEKAKLKSPRRQKVIDLTSDFSEVLGKEEFDGVILDVPCSGSGTWGRTPEMIQQFSNEKLLAFVQLQKSIVDNVVKHVKVGKPLVYMTCSIYGQENEDRVRYIVDNYPFVVEKMEVIKGYTHRADTMFAARLIRQA